MTLKNVDINKKLRDQRMTLNNLDIGNSREIDA